MKKIILCLLILLTTHSLVAQKIILHRSVGGNLTYELNSIDSITFVPFVCGVSKVNWEDKEYNTALVSSQCWLKENLDVGTMILGVNDQTNNSIVEKYCYNNDTANCTIYGGLYQWNEAMQYITTEGKQGICPTGWHILTLTELQTLAAEVGNSGNALKAIGQGSGIGAGTNTSGFSALLVGLRYGGFTNNGYWAYVWSSTESDAAKSFGGPFLSYNSDNVYLVNDNKEYGFSVRCIKDL